MSSIVAQGVCYAETVQASLGYTCTAMLFHWIVFCTTGEHLAMLRTMWHDSSVMSTGIHSAVKQRTGCQQATLMPHRKVQHILEESDEAASG